jgi:hypothetical protein
MSIKIMTKVWDESKHRGSELLILLALADRANDDGLCWPGIADLMHRGRIARRQITNILNTLQASGELVLIRRSGKPNLYVILTSCTAEEKRARMTLAMQCMGGGAMHYTSTPAIQYTPTQITSPHKVIHEPSVEPSKEPSAQHPAAALWEKATGQIVPNTPAWDRFKYAVETQPEANILEAIRIGKERQAGKPSMAYVLGILKNGVSPKPAPPVDRKPARIYS